MRCDGFKQCLYGDAYLLLSEAEAGEGGGHGGGRRGEGAGGV